MPESLFKKETLVQVLSCEIYEKFKNTFFYRTPLVAASEAIADGKNQFHKFINQTINVNDTKQINN